MSDEKSSTHSKGDFEIGHGRPPKETRFRAGKSGNPHGRPKRQATFTSIARDELARLVRTSTNADGIAQSMPAVEVIVRKAVHKAIYGDIKAARFLFDIEGVERKSAGAERGSHLGESGEEVGEDHD
jgi:hypothetical protein